MGGLFERGGRIQFRKDDGVSSPERTRIQSGKTHLQEGSVGVLAVEDQNLIRTSSW